MPLFEKIDGGCLAAQVRADLGIRTPDALQVAAGLSAGCSSLVTNDRRIPASVGGMSILQLSKIIPRPDEAPTSEERPA